MTPDGFSSFYRAHLPAVYGYLLRLSAGDNELAEDLTQDVWLALVDQLRDGHSERADIRWLITVARTRFLDHARRERLGRSKLRLLPRKQSDDQDPASISVLERLEDLQPLHRAVLVMRYVDGLGVPQIAALVGRGVPATNSLLERARSELRRLPQGDAND